MKNILYFQKLFLLPHIRMFFLVLFTGMVAATASGMGVPLLIKYVFPVVFYTPGLPKVTGNRALRASLSARYRELKSWGAVFTDGESRRVITAEMARDMAQRGERPPAGAILTPLAREEFA
jgi:hypothetical protein